MLWKRNMDRDWYLYYHMASVGQAAPQKGVFDMANTKPSRYPPDYSQYNVMDSVRRPPSAGAIYSGVEPLSSLNPTEMRYHFDPTSQPKVSSIISNRRGLMNRPMVSKLDPQQQAILQNMNLAVEYYSDKYKR